MVSDTRPHLFNPRRHFVRVSDTLYKPPPVSDTRTRRRYRWTRRSRVSDINRGGKLLSMVSDTRPHLFNPRRHFVRVSDTLYKPPPVSDTRTRRRYRWTRRSRVSDINRGGKLLPMVSDTRPHLFNPRRHFVRVSDTLYKPRPVSDTRTRRRYRWTRRSRVSDINRGGKLLPMVSDTRPHLFNPRRHFVRVSDTLYKPPPVSDTRTRRRYRWTRRSRVSDTRHGTVALAITCNPPYDCNCT
jgi:hypothetical protein